MLVLGFDPQGNLANWNGVLYAFDYGNRLRSIAGIDACHTGDRAYGWKP
jgi:hypothetical protein